MRTMPTALLLTLLFGCSNGGGTPPPAQPDTAFLDLTGTWRMTGTVLESDGIATTGLDDTTAEITFWANSGADLYAVVLDGVPARPLGAQPSSVFAVAPEVGQPLVLSTGIYYLPAADITVGLGMTLDSEQLAAATAEPGRFVFLWDFEVFDGDAMVVTSPEGVPEWTVDDDALRLGGGRLRMEARRQ